MYARNKFYPTHPSTDISFKPSQESDQYLLYLLHRNIRCKHIRQIFTLLTIARANP